MPSLALACRLSAATAAIRSLFSLAKSISRRYNSPLLAIEDDLSNVYQDSAGTLPATVGSPIGLLTDRAYGGELVSMNPPSTSSTTGWFAYLSTISSNGSALTVTSTSTNEGYAFCLQGSILAGRTYEVDIEILSRTHSAGSLQIGQTTIPLLVGRFTRTVTATNTHGVWVGVGGATVGNQATFILHSVRELKGNHATQATAGNRPTLLQYNGHPSASFNGTTNSLRLATNPIGSNLSQPYTIIVAGVCGALGAVRGFCGDGARHFLIFENGVVGPSHAGIGESLTTTTLSAGQPYVIEIVFTGSACSIWINGILAINNAPFSPPTIGTASSFFIGHRGTGSEFFNGQLTAVTAFDRVLTDSERTTIGKAFARELGVTYG